MSLVDVLTGKTLFSLPGPVSYVAFAPNGQTLAAYGDGVLRTWDMPPRKSLLWFSFIMGLLAVPPTEWAWRRARRLHRETA